MTKVYCCNFIEQIYQWFEYRKKTCRSFFVVSYKTVLNDDCLERTRARNRTVYQAPETSPIILKVVATFLVWAKTSFFNISHFI